MPLLKKICCLVPVWTAVLTAAGAVGGTVHAAPTTPNTPPAQRVIAWDGEKNAGGHGTTYVGHQAGLGESQIALSEGESHSHSHALAWTLSGHDWIMAAWGGFGPEGTGVPTAGMTNLVFWIKVTGKAPVADLQIRVQAPHEGDDVAAKFLEIPIYCPKAEDGAWHEVVIPLVDLYPGKAVPARIDGFSVGTMAFQPVDSAVWFDDIALDNRAAPAK